METAPTEHETRARNAKAQALATVLADTSITPGEARVTPIGSATWALAAEVATRRGLLGEGVTVHPPHSAATVRAVAHVLELRAQRVTPATSSGMVAALANERTNPFDPGTANANAWDAQRHPRDSQGYRARMAELAPVPETTEADLFAPFGQAVNR